MSIPIKITKDLTEIQKLKVQEIVDGGQSSGENGEALFKSSEGLLWQKVETYDDTELQNTVTRLEETLTWIEK